MTPDLVWQVLSLVHMPVGVVWSPSSWPVEVLWLAGERPYRETVRRTGGARDAKLLGRGERLLTTGADGALSVWHAFSKRLLHTLPASSPLDVQVSPDGRRVVALSLGGRLTMWSAASGAELVSVMTPGAGVSAVLRVFPAGDRLVCGGSNDSETYAAAEIRSLADGGVLHALQPEGGIRLLELSPCGAKVVTAGSSVDLWSAADGRLEGAMQRSMVFRFSQLLLSAEAERVVAAWGGACVVWDGHSRRLLRLLDLSSETPRLALLPERRLAVVTASFAGVWHLDFANQLYALHGAPRSLEGSVSAAVAGQDGRFVAACGTRVEPEERVRLHDWVMVWNASTGRPAAEASAPHVHREIGWRCAVGIAPGASASDALAAA